MYIIRKSCDMLTWKLKIAHPYGVFKICAFICICLFLFQLTLYFNAWHTMYLAVDAGRTSLVS